MHTTKTGDDTYHIDATLCAGATLNLNDDVTPLPLINFKYMSSNSCELRIGIETYKLKETLNGNIAESENTTIKSNQKYGENTPWTRRSDSCKSGLKSLPPGPMAGVGIPIPNF